MYLVFMEAFDFVGEDRDACDFFLSQIGIPKENVVKCRKEHNEYAEAKGIYPFDIFEDGEPDEETLQFLEEDSNIIQFPL